MNLSCDSLLELLFQISNSDEGTKISDCQNLSVILRSERL